MSLTRRELLRRAGLLGAASLIPNFSACINDTGSEAEGETGTGETGGDSLERQATESSDLMYVDRL